MQSGKTQSSRNFDFGRYSLLFGISGLLFLFFFFPAGMYLGFFLGTVGFTCAVVSKKSGGRPRFISFLLCGLSVALSLLFFLSFLSFYDMVRDPAAGPRITELFLNILGREGISAEQFMQLMGR